MVGVTKFISDDELGRLDELCVRYAVQGPRYTSYPTAVEFHSGVDAPRWREALIRDLRVSERNRSGKVPLSLYFHLPFCPSLCYFCACNKIITQEPAVIAPYLALLDREMELYAELLAEVGCEFEVEQLHWGGGTPNYLTPDQMRQLQRRTAELFPPFSRDADISVELDPRHCTEQHLDVLRETGFNRVSFGVQDFAPQVQQAINRIQPYAMTEQLVRWVRERGFNSVNVDLIYGLPAQTLEGFLETIDQILQIRPDRIALYGYAHVTWTVKVQKALEREHLPTPAERIQIFLRALTKFNDAGYRYIGMDHLALPEDSLSVALDAGRLNRNFMGYSSHRGTSILGMGVSSISSTDGAFAQNVKSVDGYRALLEQGILPTERGYERTSEDRMRGEVIEAVMCQGELDLKAFSERWSVDFWNVFSAAREGLEHFAAEGLLDLSGERLRVTTLGKLFARNIAMLFDSYLEKHRERQKPVFSQAV